MIERYAVVFADKIKKSNPDETAPHDVLVFGFIIVFNIIMTTLLLTAVGFIIGKPFYILAIAFAFMSMRLLTGGPHLNHAFACSLGSTLFMVIGSFLSVHIISVIFYAVCAFYLYIRYAPFYEQDQVVHAISWEKKKKNFALCILFMSSLLAVFFDYPAFLIGAYLQSITIIPFMIKGIHRMNDVLKGGDKFEESDC
ncbi:accessory gene regulator B family protein [Niallia sp. 01092]|uniref:accessory gene regulator B family protein n=1 Tax=unclassified Niallia TaxID=2837522 RepID=UPI003FD06C58